MNNLLEKTYQASILLAGTTNEQRCVILKSLLSELIANKESIFKSNHEDYVAAKENSTATALLKRLVLDDTKYQSCLDGIKHLISLKDPLNVTTLATELTEGLRLYRVTCPIGVIAVIFEARPEVAIQIAALTIRSGNAVVLKGSVSTKTTLETIYKTVQVAFENANCDALSPAVTHVSTHDDISELLQMDKYIDLIIPRGSVGHADGVCTVYIDEEVDSTMAVKIVKDSKVDYPAACNACEI